MRKYNRDPAHTDPPTWFLAVFCLAAFAACAAVIYAFIRLVNHVFS